MSVPTTIRTGGEIDTFCSKCNLDLGHTILAMVGPKVMKVKCNTCGADHSFRGEQPLAAARPAPRTAANVMSPRKPAPPTWHEAMRSRNVALARRYSIRESFAVDDVILHPVFGLGVVTAARHQKVDVLFENDEKTLVCGKEA